MEEAEKEEAPHDPVGEEVEAQPKQKPAKAPRATRSPTARKPRISSLGDSRTALGAGAAGVGGGTLIAIIASNWPDGIVKTVLIWAAPTATITFSAIWIWARRKINEAIADWEAKTAFTAAKSAIAEALNNPALTPEQRAQFEEKKVELDQMIVDKKMSKVTSHVET